MSNSTKFTWSFLISLPMCCITYGKSRIGLDFFKCPFIMMIIIENYHLMKSTIAVAEHGQHAWKTFPIPDWTLSRARTNFMNSLPSVNKHGWGCCQMDEYYCTNLRKDISDKIWIQYSLLSQGNQCLFSFKFLSKSICILQWHWHRIEVSNLSFGKILHFTWIKDH